MENQTPEVTVSQRPKSNPILWVVIGVAILAAGIGVGLAVGKYSSSPYASPTCLCPDKTVCPKNKGGAGDVGLCPEKLPAYLDPTANWKTYTNEDYGFSFSYPDELTYLYDHLKGGNILLQNFDGSSPRKELDSDFQMVITANDTNGKLLEDYPKQWETELGKLPTETILVGGNTAIKGFSGQKYQAVPTVWFSKNSTTFMIQLSHPKSTNKIWFDQILSTFKFVFLGYDLQRRTDVNAVIRPGLELYKFDHKQYPDSLNLLVPAYLITLPVDPVTKESYPYKVSVNKSDYNITVAMEDGTVLVVESPK